MKIKNKKGIVIAVVIILLFAICLFGICHKKMNKENSDTQESVQNEWMQEELADYIGEYFASTSVSVYISEEDMQMISEEISTGIIDSMPQDSLSDEEKEELQKYVLQTVQEQLTSFNEGKDEADGTVITQELIDYINHTIVPNLTVQLQLTKGDIDDLKASLAAASSEYAGDRAAYDALIDRLANRIAEMESSGATDEELEVIKAELDTLSSFLGDYTAILDESLNGITLYTEDGHLYGQWTDEEGNVISKKLDFAQ